MTDKARSPFVCSVGGCTFIIRFNPDHELHIFTCKDDKGLNFTEKHPPGTSEINRTVFVRAVDGCEIETYPTDTPGIRWIKQSSQEICSDRINDGCLLAFWNLRS